MKAPMPEGVRGEVAGIVYQNKLYAIGGNVATNAVPRNEVYDPATDKWRSLPPMPVARDHLGLALVNGKIYTFGGFVEQNRCPHSKCFVYDTATDKWAPIAALSRPRGAISAMRPAAIARRSAGSGNQVPLSVAVVWMRS